MKNNKYCISSSYAAHNIETPICPKVITPRNYSECGICPLVQAIIGADKELLANGVKFGKPSKLTSDQLTDIRSKRLTQPAFAKLYNVSVGYIAKIQANKHHE